MSWAATGDAVLLGAYVLIAITMWWMVWDGLRGPLRARCRFGLSLTTSVLSALSTAFVAALWPVLGLVAAFLWHTPEARKRILDVLDPAGSGT